MAALDAPAVSSQYIQASPRSCVGGERMKSGSLYFKFSPSLLHSRDSHFNQRSLYFSTIDGQTLISISHVAPTSRSAAHCPADHMNPVPSISKSFFLSGCPAVKRPHCLAAVGEQILNRCQITEKDPSGWNIRQLIHNSGCGGTGEEQEQRCQKRSAVDIS